jgi:hypothetical protein
MDHFTGMVIGVFRPCLLCACVGVHGEMLVARTKCTPFEAIILGKAGPPETPQGRAITKAYEPLLPTKLAKAQ